MSKKNGNKYLCNTYVCSRCHRSSPESRKAYYKKGAKARKEKRWKKLRERQSKLNGKRALPRIKLSLRQQVTRGQKLLFPQSAGAPCRECGSLGLKTSYDLSKCAVCARRYARRLIRRKRQEDPERYARDLAQLRQWKKDNPGRTRAHKRANNQERYELEGNDLTSEQWRAIMEAFGWSCVYCEERSRNLQRDHILPFSSGGKFTMGNIIPACGPCNQDRSTTNFRDYLNDEQKYDAILQTLGDIEYQSPT